VERVISDRLSTLLGKDVVPHITVNPAILGGLVVRFGDRAMDGSLRRQLLSLKREMMNAGLPELPADA
jgi:F-type H+-transporting ATPase subunit delta